VQIIGTPWALLYFISFYVITVLLLVNLVVAFVLEAFFAETELAGTALLAKRQISSLLPRAMLTVINGRFMA